MLATEKNLLCHMMQTINKMKESKMNEFWGYHECKLKPMTLKSMNDVKEVIQDLYFIESITFADLHGTDIYFLESKLDVILFTIKLNKEN